MGTAPGRLAPNSAYLPAIFLDLKMKKTYIHMLKTKTHFPLEEHLISRRDVGHATERRYRNCSNIVKVGQIVRIAAIDVVLKVDYW